MTNEDYGVRMHELVGQGYRVALYAGDTQEGRKVVAVVSKDGLEQRGEGTEPHLALEAALVSLGVAVAPEPAAETMASEAEALTVEKAEESEDASSEESNEDLQ